MTINTAKLSDRQLRQLIENHERKKAFDKPLYRDALEELNRRKCGGLQNLDRTLAFVRERAHHRRFLSYGEVADVHGVPWSQARYPMNDHLWALVRYGHARNLPMLSAVIVNAENLKSGHMEPQTLKGFVAAAESLGYSVTEPEEFLREQQNLVFDWASSAGDGAQP